MTQQQNPLKSLSDIASDLIHTYEEFRGRVVNGYVLPPSIRGDVRLWRAIAAKVRELNVDPYTFVEAQFQLWRSPFPYPNQLKSELAVKNCKDWVARRGSGTSFFAKEDVSSCDKQSASVGITQFRGRLQALKRVVAISDKDTASLILDPGFPSDPLFRVIMAPCGLTWDGMEEDLRIARTQINKDRPLRSWLQNHEDSTIRQKVWDLCGGQNEASNKGQTIHS